MNWDAVFSEHKGKPVSEIARAVGKTKGAVRIAARYRGIELPPEPPQIKPKPAPMPKGARAQILARLKGVPPCGPAIRQAAADLQTLWPGASLRQIIATAADCNAYKYRSREK